MWIVWTGGDHRFWESINISLGNFDPSKSADWD